MANEQFFILENGVSLGYRLSEIRSFEYDPIKSSGPTTIKKLSMTMANGTKLNVVGLGAERLFNELVKISLKVKK